MSNALRNIFRNSSTRILVIIFFSLLFITGFFIIYGYYSKLAVYEQDELNKLESIARTLALEIDGTAHQGLYVNYPKKDDISLSHDNEVYNELHKRMRAAQLENNVSTDIYTMVYVPEREVFDFVITSGENPYFRHEWRKYKELHVSAYETGARSNRRRSTRPEIWSQRACSAHSCVKRS